MGKTGKHCKLLFLSTAFFIAMPLQAELRDPTRPSGFLQSAQVSDDRLESSEGLNLQAIFYSPQTPGVLINGRRFAVGDQVADAKIKTIHADRVVLISAEGEKEIRLTMPSVKSVHEIPRAKAAEGNK